MEQHISWADFEKLIIKTGTIIEASHFPKARKPAYKLLIDFGEEVGKLRSSAQITTHYSPGSLIGQSIIAIINFPPKQIADFISECLVLGVYDENNDVILVQPGILVSNGQKIG